MAAENNRTNYKEGRIACGAMVGVSHRKDMNMNTPLSEREARRQIKGILSSTNPIPWYRNRWTLVWTVIIPIVLSVIVLLYQNKQLWEANNALTDKINKLEAAIHVSS